MLPIDLAWTDLLGSIFSGFIVVFVAGICFGVLVGAFQRLSNNV